MKRERNWTVLLIGGASGTGKSSSAYELAKFYQVNVMEADDIFQAVKAMTTRATHPAIHYFSSGINWLDIGVEGNIKWLIDVSKELVPGLKAIVDNHLESDVPVIIEGDFILPEFVESFKNPKVNALFIIECDKEQILQNYQAREGGQLQHFRADISKKYGEWLLATCEKLGISVIESKPWSTVIDRSIQSMEGIRIITNRLVLEPLGMKYLQSTHAYASDLENTMLMVYLPNKSIEETIEFLTHVDNEWKQMNPLTYEFAILLDRVHIGAVSIDLEDDRKTGELGWIIDKKHWKQGYATEAAIALIDYAIDKLGVLHFIAHCDSENTGSYKIMEKLGMKLVDRSFGRKNKSSDEDREELKYERIIGQ